MAIHYVIQPSGVKAIMSILISSQLEQQFNDLSKSWMQIQLIKLMKAFGGGRMIWFYP